MSLRTAGLCSTMRMFPFPLGIGKRRAGNEDRPADCLVECAVLPLRLLLLLLLLLGLDGAFHDEKALCVFIKFDGEKPVRVDGVVAELTSLSCGIGVEACHAEAARGRVVDLAGEGCVAVGVERQE